MKDRVQNGIIYIFVSLNDQSSSIITSAKTVKMAAAMAFDEYRETLMHNNLLL